MFPIETMIFLSNHERSRQAGGVQTMYSLHENCPCMIFLLCDSRQSSASSSLCQEIDYVFEVLLIETWKIGKYLPLDRMSRGWARTSTTPIGKARTTIPIARRYSIFKDSPWGSKARMLWSIFGATRTVPELQIDWLVYQWVSSITRWIISLLTSGE